MTLEGLPTFPSPRPYSLGFCPMVEASCCFDRPSMDSTAEYVCAFCGETNTTFIDVSAGLSQTYIEDCQVCCRPNQLYVTIDDVTLDIEINSDYLE